MGMNFDAVCRRASGRRAYNRRRRLARQRRIAQIIVLQARGPHLTGRELAALLRVHESTVSRDLKAVARIREEWRRFMAEHGPAGVSDVPLLPESFSFGRRAGRTSMSTRFKFKDGVSTFEGRWQGSAGAFKFKWVNGVRVW